MLDLGKSKQESLRRSTWAKNKMQTQQEAWTGQGPVLYDNQMNKEYDSYAQ